MNDCVPALVIAHPGHELLLHHWMEVNHPVVFALTDGSGSEGMNRSPYSRRVVMAAGGTVGPVFGIAPDRRWYDAILDGDADMFRDVAACIAAACLERGVTEIVTDPVEFFNPMHDLCAALARCLARRIQAATGREIALYDYPIESPPAARVDSVIALDSGALERKWSAAASIPPLAHEMARRDRAAHAVERLRRVDAAEGWPLPLTREPLYESIGRERIAKGSYERLITYAQHVRPLALRLGAG